MVELCLMVSRGYPLGFHSEHLSNRLSEDFHHFLPYHGSNQDSANPLSFNLNRKQKEERRSTGGLLDSNHFVRIDLTSKRPTLIDFQDYHSDSVLLSFGIAERCARHDKILKLLSSNKSIEEQGHLLDLSMLYDLMGPESPITDLPQQPLASCSTWCFNDARPLQNLIHPTTELYFNEPFLGQLPCNCTGTEMNDVLSVISDFYSKNTNKSSMQTMLVPYFERRRRARADIGASKLAAAETASLKSHDKAKEKTSQKKKTNARTSKERDIYSNSYLHACESLLSIIVDRKQQGKNVILSLKKSSPQLPQLLTQVSASIAGTGIAVVLSVLCRVACSRGVHFCGSRVLSTGLGLGLVWLSWAVNKLRDTVITIGKTSGAKVGEKEDEMMSDLDRNLKDIYFRVAALMAVVVLKVA